MTRRPIPLVGTLPLVFIAGALVGIAADRPAALDHGTADITWTDTPAARSHADDLWAACVWGNLVAPDHGTDADMHRCDDLYAGITGHEPADVDLYLYCPSVPEAGGCYGDRRPDLA